MGNQLKIIATQKILLKCINMKVTSVIDITALTHIKHILSSITNGRNNIYIFPIREKKREISNLKYA